MKCYSSLDFFSPQPFKNVKGILSPEAAANNISQLQGGRIHSLLILGLGLRKAIIIIIIIPGRAPRPE
jgi:hypothetical protein